MLSSPEMLRFRKEVLGKSSEQPDLVVVTATGAIDTKHPAWSVPNRRKLIATSSSGLAKIQSILEQPISVDVDSTMTGAEWLAKNGVVIQAFEDPSSPTSVDFLAMMSFLKSQWNVHFADVSAGPTLISLMMKAYVKEDQTAVNNFSDFKTDPFLYSSPSHDSPEQQGS